MSCSCLMCLHQLILQAGLGRAVQNAGMRGGLVSFCHRQPSAPAHAKSCSLGREQCWESTFLPCTTAITGHLHFSIALMESCKGRMVIVMA